MREKMGAAEDKSAHSSSVMAAISLSKSTQMGCGLLSFIEKYAGSVVLLLAVSGAAT